MKTYRRIEITAFRRRVTIVSGHPSTQTQDDVWLNDADSSDTIEPGSEEGREILIEAVRVLEEKLFNIKSEPPALAGGQSNAIAKIDF